MIRGTRRHRQREIGRAGAKRSRPLGSTGGGGIHQVSCRGARARSGLTSEGAPRARSRAQKPPEMGGASHARRISPPSSRFGGRAVSLAATLGHRWALVAFDSENSAIKFHALAAPQRGTRAKRARPPTGSSQPRRSISTAPAASDGPSTPKPRASARSRRHFGGAPPGPGGALSAAAGPRRVDVPVRAEDFELSAAVVRTPGAEPEPYGAQRKPWGPPAPRRAFRRVVPQTLGGRARKAGAPNFGARPTTRCLPHVSWTGRPRTAPRGRWAARGQPPRPRRAKLPQIAVFSPPRAAIWVSRPI